MQREVAIHDLNVERLPQTFHTHGAEVAPRSDVIGEYFQRWHLRLLPVFVRTWLGAMFDALLHRARASQGGATKAILSRVAGVIKPRVQLLLLLIKKITLRGLCADNSADAHA